MDEEMKFRLDDVDRKTMALDKKIDDQGKRFDDVKWFVGGGALIFSILLGIAGWNFINERAGLRDFQKEITDLVRKTDETKLELYSVKDGTDLSGQEVATEFSTRPATKPDEKTTPQFTFSFVVRNTGENTSGPMYIKLYTKEDFKLIQKSSDNAKYQYEDYVSPIDLKPDSIPAKMSITHVLDFVLPATPLNVKPGRHSALLQVYYGKAKVVSAPIVLVTQ
jgi:hypothetical protein